MHLEEIEQLFKKSVIRVQNYTEPLPADVLLRLYAYYKIATGDNQAPASKKPLINAFKANALFQARNVSKQQAKQKYIALVNSYFDF